MPKHIHAELMAQYAQDAMETDTPWDRWEFMDGNIDWTALVRNPAWDECSMYRRKPRTLNINGYEVPEPVRKPITMHDPYYIPQLGGAELCCMRAWCDKIDDYQRLEKGIIHLTPEAAIAHTNALLSFTRQQK